MTFHLTDATDRTATARDRRCRGSMPRTCTSSRPFSAADWNMTGYAKHAGNRYNAPRRRSTVFNFFANHEEDCSPWSTTPCRASATARAASSRTATSSAGTGTRPPWRRRYGQGRRARARASSRRSPRSSSSGTPGRQPRIKTTYSDPSTFTPTGRRRAGQPRSSTSSAASSCREELAQCGALGVFDKTRRHSQLDHLQKARDFVQPTTSDDPIMADLMEKRSGTVYATDAWPPR